jgi:hypothetical protein
MRQSVTVSLGSNERVAGKGRRKFVVALAIILMSSYINTCIKHLDKYFIRIHVFIYVYTCIEHLEYFIYVRYRYFWVFVRSRMTPQKNQFMNFFTGNQFMNFFTGYEFPHGFYDVISFWRRHYDVILLWRHFDAVIMTSYYCDVILTPSLWRHIFVTSFWRRHYDVSIKGWQKLARGDFVFHSTLQALHSRLSSGEAWKISQDCSWVFSSMFIEHSKWQW